MRQISPMLRMTLGLVSLTISVACVGQTLGLLPDRTSALLDGRRALCEALAVHCSLAAQRRDTAMVEAAVRALAERNRDVHSAALRLDDGTTLVEVGEHASQWRPTAGNRSIPTQVVVPISAGDRRWGTVEVRFAPLSASALGVLSNPELRYIVFSASVSGLAFYAFLQFTLRRQLSSAAAGGVSDRVRATLDTLVEGVLLMDKDQRIALANEAFARTVGVEPGDLEGRPAREFPWAHGDEAEDATALPWSSALSEGRRQVGSLLELEAGPVGRRVMSVNATPIIGDDGAQRGVLATFDDLTVIERKNVQLRRVLERLKQSRTEIRQQNLKLRELATLDPLTACLNRRSFFESFDVVWRATERDGQALSCIMLDIDHFKSVNDRHGHAVGDEALRQVSSVLRGLSRGGDLVCRYGGEEFCVVLPQVDLDGAVLAAERFRREIESRRFAEISVTSSFGVATWGLGARTPKELIDQADQALYAAKKTGRNRVVRCDAMPALVPESEKPPAEAHHAAAEPPESVSYPAVTSLVSALACRDPDTAAHSRRVADLCVAVARGLMSEHDRYQLEVAALLHDIGKLGTPDRILRKPGPLTEHEWGMMGAHERMGEEILSAVFPSEPIIDVVRNHHAWYGGNPRDPELPRGQAIPLGARILAIADAYDAMVSDRVYRAGRSRADAFAELRRAAGRQFDPELVERFIDLLERGDGASSLTLKESLTKRAAFKIGLQIERLAEALDDSDTTKLATMVSRLKATAAEHGITPIAESAGRLQTLLGSGGDWLAVTELTGELIEICRSTQRSYLESFEPSAVAR